VQTGKGNRNFTNQLNALKTSITITLMHGDKQWIHDESDMMGILSCESIEITKSFTTFSNNHGITTYTTIFAAIRECLLYNLVQRICHISQLERGWSGTTFLFIGALELTG
jgi:hypothetical protein